MELDNSAGSGGISCPSRLLSKSAALLVLVAVVTGCGTGRDLSPDDQFKKRVYIGAGGLASQLEPDTDEVEGVSVDESISAGGSLLLGLDLSNRFSIEGHVSDLGQSELAPDGSIDYQVGGLSALVYALNSEERRQRRTGFSAFGRVGVGALENDSEGVEFEQVNQAHLLVGAGLEYGFENGLAARAEFTAHETDAKYAQLALLYRFGKNRHEAVVEEPEPEVADVDPIAVTPVPLPPTTIEKEGPDTDADGVTDSADNCPGTPAGRPVNDTGCEILNGVVEGVNFASGSAELTAEGRAALSEVVAVLNEYPDVRIAVQAHTDNRGDAEENLQLSRRRAVSVARFFIEEGIAGQRLRPQAFGESRPRVSNATPTGRSENRRVEIIVID